MSDNTMDRIEQACNGILRMRSENDGGDFSPDVFYRQGLRDALEQFKRVGLIKDYSLVTNKVTMEER
jgi:hypothetical protein